MTYTLSEIAPSASSGRFVKRRNTSTGGHGRYKPTTHDFIASFYAVLRRWESETLFLSDPDRIIAHPSFKALVENAHAVLPQICGELDRKPSQLVWVLEDAFGEKPYQPEDYGKFDKMALRWLDYIDRLK